MAHVGLRAEQAALLVQLAHGRPDERLPGLDLAAEAVVLAHAEAALLVPEQHPPRRHADRQDQVVELVRFRGTHWGRHRRRECVVGDGRCGAVGTLVRRVAS